MKWLGSSELTSFPYRQNHRCATTKWSDFLVQCAIARTWTSTPRARRQLFSSWNQAFKEFLRLYEFFNIFTKSHKVAKFFLLLILLLFIYLLSRQRVKRAQRSHEKKKHLGTYIYWLSYLCLRTARVNISFFSLFSSPTHTIKHPTLENHRRSLDYFVQLRSVANSTCLLRFISNILCCESMFIGVFCVVLRS